MNRMDCGGSIIERANYEGDTEQSLFLSRDLSNNNNNNNEP